MIGDLSALGSVAQLSSPETPAESPREAAEQVEALFVKMLLKEVRKASTPDGLLNSREMETFHDLFDDQLATEISESGQLGLADAIEAQLTGRVSPRPSTYARRHAAYLDAHDHGVVEGRITSDFGHRHHPILHRRKMHYGIDIGAAHGSTIHALRSGVVTRAEEAGTYGNVVYVDHGDGLETRYAHASRILVQVGDRVSAGEALAEVGSTGRSTGPHLHFEVRQDGKAVDPRPYLHPRSEILPKSHAGSGR